MDYYDDTDDRRRRRAWAILFLLIYFFVGGLCILFVSHTIYLPQPELNILVDLTDEIEYIAPPPPAPPQELTPTDQVSVADAAPARRSTQVPPPPPPRPQMTTEQPDAPEIPFIDPNAKTTEEQTVIDTSSQTQTPPTPEPPAEPVRTVNERALFPGQTTNNSTSTQNSSSTSDRGTPGSQGVAGGVPGSSGVSLTGRYLTGDLPRPAYTVDAEGRVVMSITVNSEGRVTRADYVQAGSTTNHPELIAAARAAALKARFTIAEAELQTGTITYIFRLN